jgi:ornithine--oxo-acid transaminase
MTLTQSLIEKEKRYCAQNYSPLPVVLNKAQGVWVWDVEGKKYLDMVSAYSAVSLGHSHPRIVKTLIEQSQKLCLSSRAFYAEALCHFLEKICEMSGMDMALPMNTGAEAVETAIKAARRWGYFVKKIPSGKAEIIVANNNFHGRTTTIISFSSEDTYKEGFDPYTPGFISIPFGDAQALEKAITLSTCAFLVEPIQGEAGIVTPPEGWLKQVQDICKKNNVLLIVDEIQSGLGRTGKLFAFEHDNIKPDGLIIGKALGGGMLPVSLFLAKKEVMQVFTPGSHGSTFGGNSLAAAVGLETLRIIEDEKLVQKSAALGSYMFEKLQNLKSPLIKAIRGKGLWVGIEIDSLQAKARKVAEGLLEKGVLSKETHESVIRFAPPLVIQKDEIDWAISQLEKVLETLN